MEFKYNEVRTVLESIEIESIGNCCIEAHGVLGDLYYLYIRTDDAGMSEIFQYGPSVPDIPILPNSVSCSYSKTMFSEKRIAKTIDSFLNNPYREIVGAELVDPRDALDNCISIVDTLRNSMLDYD